MLRVNPRTIIKSDKFKHEFVVEKTEDGFIFFGIRTTKGPIPKELTGTFSTMKKAVEQVLRYEAHARPSATVKVEENRKRREAQKEA